MTTDDLRTRAREAAERPTIALAREIAAWDQDVPGTNRIPHWSANLAAHLLDKGWAHAAQQPSREDIVVKDAEVEVERVVGYNAAARREIDRLAAIVERVREALAGHELARVITLHRIECTGLGEVTCRACRERGWMSWPEFHKHVARAVRTYLLTGDENDE